MSLREARELKQTVARDHHNLDVDLKRIENQLKRAVLEELRYHVKRLEEG